MAQFNLQLSINSNGSITSTWSPVSGAVRYKLYMFTPGQSTVYFSEDNLTATSYTSMGDLKDNQQYEVVLTAYDSTGMRIDSDGAKILIPLGFYDNKPLGIPGNISATVSVTSVTIRWNAVVRATGYDILFNGTVYHTTGTSREITGLSPMTSYSYSVRAKNTGQTGSYSAANTVTTLVQTPAIPTGIRTSSTENSITVSWGAVNGATGYDILWNGAVYSVTETYRTFTGLSPNQSYTCSVRAKNAGAASAYSTSFTVMTTSNPPAGASAFSSENSVTISWNPEAGAASYDVLWNGTVYRVNGTSKTFTELSSNGRYTYQIRSNNASGSSSYSAEKTVKTAPAAPPKAGMTTTPAKDSVTINWGAVDGATSYDILFNGKVYRVNGTTLEIPGLTPETSYTYQIRSNNEDGSSSYSAPQTITTLPNPPARPENVNATATINAVTVSWNAVSKATGYDLSLNGSLYDVTGTSKTVTGLHSDTNYTYQVRAKNAGGPSAYSAAKAIRTLPEPPAVPEGINATATANSVTVSWNMAERAAEYDIIFSGQAYSTTGTTKEFSGLSPDTNYSYQVRAKNAGGASSYSAVQTVRTLLNTPENISAVPLANSVTLSWNAVARATGYEIIFDGTVYPVTGTRKEITGLLAYTDYTYAVRAKNSAVYSEYSQESRVKTLADPPEVPQVSAEAALNEVRISWKTVRKATRYEVLFNGKTYHAEGKSQTFSALESERLSGDDRLKVFSDLKPNTSHRYSVRAVNGNSPGEYSPVKNISTGIKKENGLPNQKPKKNYPDGRMPHTGLDPVNALTGAFLWSYTYLEDYGKDQLHFTVMYDSQRNGFHRVLGSKWACSFDYQLHLDDDYAYFITPYDEVTPFAKSSGNGGYEPVEGSNKGYRVAKRDDGTYLVSDADGSGYLFGSRRSPDATVLREIIAGGQTVYRFEENEEGQITSIEGRYGAALTLAYSGGHISGVTDAMGHSAAFEYEGECLTSVQNADGKRMSFTYDDIGNLLTVTDFSGKENVTNRYDLRSRVVEQSTAGRGTTYAAYDDENRITAFTDELGNTTKYFYDESYRVTRVELAGVSVQSKYNDAGQLTEQIDGLGNSTKMEYDEYGRMNRAVYSDGTSEQIFYNEGNYPVRTVNREGSESLYGYDAENNLISFQDERGYTGQYSYDSKNNLVSHTDKNGYIWTYSYDSDNHLKQAADPLGNQYQYRHDALGRLLSYTSPTGKKTEYRYSEAGDLLGMTEADGTVLFEYNENGNQTSVTDRMGHKQCLTYNEMGQVSMATDFLGNEHRFTYDEKGNLIAETDPLGCSQSYTYDAMGNQTVWKDRNGGTTNYYFNAANQLTEVKDAAGGMIKYAYDSMGQITHVTDPLKNKTSYAYDSMGRIKEVTNALGDSVSYLYDKAGNLINKTDENGVSIAYTYDQENQLISILSPAGTVNFTYDKIGRLCTVQDETGNSENVKHDADGNVTEVLDKENNKKAFTYDKSGRLSEETNPDGGKTSYEYDRNGNCIKITDACGNCYSYEYDANNRLTKGIDPLRNETSYQYNARGELISVTDARGQKTSFEYDGNGNLIVEVNPDGGGGRKVHSYDKLNRLKETIDEEGFKRLFSYDANGNMVSFTDANGNQWVYEYDALNRMTGVTGGDGGRQTFTYTKTGRLKQITDQEGAVTTYSYDDMGRLVTMTDHLQHSLNFTYNMLGRRTSQTDARGNIITYKYSPNGNVISVEDEEGQKTTYTYDTVGRLLTETNRVGSVIRYEYNAIGQVTAMTNALGGRTTFTYKANGEIAAVTDENGGTTHYRYDACGNLTQVTDELGNVVVYEYDAMNNQIRECISESGKLSCITLYQYDKKRRCVREINPLLDEKSYTYDGNGNVIKILDEDQYETTVRYDLNNKPVSMSYSDGKDAYFRYNKRGELIELKDWNGTVSMQYDIQGLRKVTDHNGRMTDYGYDANGNVQAITYPDGSVVRYDYYANNRIKSVASDSAQQKISYEYDAEGNLTKTHLPNSGMTIHNNAAGIPKEVIHGFNVGGKNMQNKLSYDAAGNIVGSEKTGKGLEFTNSTSYTYDALGRLLSFQEGNNAESYGYDALGNRTLKKVNGVPECTYQYNAASQLTSRTENGTTYDYIYDRRGNLTEEKRGGRPIKRYAYDATGHMCLGENLESGETTRYGYNGLYMRVSNTQTLTNPSSGYVNHAGAEKHGGFRTKEVSYVIDYHSGVNNELMSYEKGFGASRVVYGRGYERLEQEVRTKPDAPMTARAAIASKNIGKALFHPDLLGSVLFAVSDQGKVIRHAERGPWGNLKVPVQRDLNSAGVENSMLFTNYSHDEVIDKYFAQARFYDAGVGRMLGKDPVKRGPNGYPYCKNNPVNYIDPTGQIPTAVAGGILGAFLGGLAGFADSAISQIGSGEDFDFAEAFGSAANQAVIDGIRGAMLGSGVGLVTALAANLAAGTAGSAIEQAINGGNVDFRKSLTDGMTNAATSAIYGTNPFKNLGSAIGRGMGAGAATAAIDNLYRTGTDPRNGPTGRAATALTGAQANLIGNHMPGGKRDPKGGCGGTNPFGGGLSQEPSRGYRASTKIFNEPRRGSGLEDFLKDVLKGTLLGGISSALMFGGGKVLEKLKNSVKNVGVGNEGGSNVKYYNPDGSPIWPPNRGFDGKPSVEGLKPGTLVDRYGYDGGTFVSPKGTPYTQRALPVGTDSKPYTVFEVLKPVEVNSGKIAPWFGEQGGGTQYEFNRKISELLKDNIIRKVGS